MCFAASVCSVRILLQEIVGVVVLLNVVAMSAKTHPAGHYQKIL